MNTNHFFATHNSNPLTTDATLRLSPTHVEPSKSVEDSHNSSALFTIGDRDTPWPAGKYQYSELSLAKFAQIEQFIDENLHEPIPLDALAAIACMSPSHFGRCFKNALGLAPGQYIILRRIERAKHLLAHTDLAVTEIGLLVGYQELSNFIKAFRKSTATTPGEYRKKWQNPIRNGS